MTSDSIDAMKYLRKCLVLSHRYLGIALCLVVMMWFATGITMMYVGGMPRLTPELRLERLPETDLSRVRLSVAEAADRAGVAAIGTRALLLSTLDRPVYRFSGGETTTVFADTGELFEGLDVAGSRRVASRFLGVPAGSVHYVRTLDTVDQWTLVQSRQLPLHKFRVDDEDGTEVYVEPATAEVAMMTTRRSRALAWVSTIPHWMYFTALRLNQPVWYQVMVWAAGLACVLAVLGLMLTVTQFRRTRPFQWSRAVPYTGAMRWHYVTGAVFGITTFTFAFSGLLSMEPFAWTNATGLEVPRTALTGGPVDLSRFPRMEAAAWAPLLDGRAIKEVEFLRIQDAPYYAVRHTGRGQPDSKRERLHQPYYVTGRAEPNRLLVQAQTLDVQAPFSEASLVARLRAAIPEARVVESATLADYDSYYYSRARQTPLPVVRVKFDDPARTWVYIDPETNQVLAEIHRLARVERWLYNGLHSLDFAFWYNRRPLWDGVMIALCLGGFSTSALGLLLGLKRIRRAARRLAAEPGARGSHAESPAAEALR
jgi:hypothetical protein